MNAVVGLLNALSPLVSSSMPLLLLLGGWWIKRLTDKQSRDLKAHSDDNVTKIQNTVTSASGTFKALSGAKSDGP